MENNMDWHELVEIVSQGQRALTQIENVKAIVRNKKYDSDAIEAISAILGIKEKENEDA